jgi:signal transduction histidine kinase
LTKGLFPVEVDSEGLMAALAELAETVSAQSGKQCMFRCQQTVEVTGNDVATHLFRIAQEATNNAIRHSSAERITISLRVGEGCLVLEIRDDGIGIRPPAVRGSDGIGLRIMRYRANVLGGTLTIAAPVGGGTLVTCKVRDGDIYARHAAPHSADLHR